MSEETCVKLVVEVRRKHLEGEKYSESIMSAHRPLTKADAEQMKEWPSAGLAQVSHALFVEALRREAYTTMIAQLSKGVHSHDLDAKELESSLRAHLIEMVDKFAASAVEEALKMGPR